MPTLAKIDRQSADGHVGPTDLQPISSARNQTAVDLDQDVCRRTAGGRGRARLCVPVNCHRLADRRQRVDQPDPLYPASWNVEIDRIVGAKRLLRRY